MNDSIEKVIADMKKIARLAQIFGEFADGVKSEAVLMWVKRLEILINSTNDVNS